MGIKRYFFGFQSQGPQNPYVKGAAGRQEWNDRYMNMAKMIRHWQIAMFLSLIALTLALLTIAKIATQSKVRPFIVETNQGQPYAIKPLAEAPTTDQRIINFAINQFIMSTRTIVSDKEAENNLLHKAYAYSANQTIVFLRDYYQKTDPYKLGQEHTVSVNIINSLPLGRNIWQITWDETKRNAIDGHVVNVTRWMANIRYQFGEVNPQFMQENPFGLYVTEVAWSPNQPTA